MKYGDLEIYTGPNTEIAVAWEGDTAYFFGAKQSWLEEGVVMMWPHNPTKPRKKEILYGLRDPGLQAKMGGREVTDITTDPFMVLIARRIADGRPLPKKKPSMDETLQELSHTKRWPPPSWIPEDQIPEKTDD